MTLNDQQKTILMGILVDTDALWTPFRFNRTNGPAAAAVVERRSTYTTKGVAIIGTGDAATRKAFERNLSSLADGGLLILSRSGSRGVFGRLTVRGDDMARQMFPSSTAAEAWPALERIRAVEVAFGDKSNAGYMLEHDILGTGPVTDSKPFYDLEDELLPLLARGYVASWGDAAGRMGYKTTTAGKSALTTGKPKPPATVEYCPQFADAFSEQFGIAEAVRNLWHGEPSHVAVPLSAGRWPKLAV